MYTFTSTYALGAEGPKGEQPVLLGKQEPRSDLQKLAAAGRERTCTLRTRQIHLCPTIAPDLGGRVAAFVGHRTRVRQDRETVTEAGLDEDGGDLSSARSVYTGWRHAGKVVSTDLRLH